MARSLFFGTKEINGHVEGLLLAWRSGGRLGKYGSLGRNSLSLANVRHGLYSSRPRTGIIIFRYVSMNNART